MKKFLGKKAVMWSFLGAAIAFLVLYVCLLVRPVTTITPYKGKGEIMGMKYDVSYTFKGGNKLVMEGETGGMDMKQEVWVAYDVYSFIQGPETEDMSRKEFFKELDEMKEAYPDMYKEAFTDINAFRIKETMGDETVVFTNVGAIVFAVVGGIVEAGLASFAVLSILANKKKA